MRCVACNRKITHPTKRQIRVPHQSGKKNKYTIVHEEEKLCSICVGYSELYFDEEESLDWEDLGIHVDHCYTQKQFDEY